MVQKWEKCDIISECYIVKSPIMALLSTWRKKISSLTTATVHFGPAMDWQPAQCSLPLTAQLLGLYVGVGWYGRWMNGLCKLQTYNPPQKVRQRDVCSRSFEPCGLQGVDDNNCTFSVAILEMGAHIGICMSPEVGQCSLLCSLRCSWTVWQRGGGHRYPIC